MTSRAKRRKLWRPRGPPPRAAAVDQDIAVVELGAIHAINYREEDIVARVREVTQGRGADLILDPIGGTGFGRNFAMLVPLGMVISYGRLDGPPDADLLTAMRANSAQSPALRFFTIHSFTTGLTSAQRR